ncbi:MAG TPA: hypothetical protein VMX38_22120 [Verrucomicrobiae bacterium]|nr:hypothetical protein [Verrucomicrobiae bacterium]
MALKIVRYLACFALASTCTLISYAQQASSGTSAATSSSAQAKNPAASSGTDSSPAQQGQPQQNQTQQDKDKTDQQSEKGKNAGTSNDRLFYTLPNFLTMESRKQLPPLTTGQKFWVVTRGSFDYIQAPWYAFLAGVGQAEDSEPGLGQGWGAYGKRFATSFADGTVENYMTGAVLPSVLHQDPRFYELGHGSFVHRTLYAVSRNVVTLSDSGKKEFNYSEVVGGAMAAAISTYSYHPRSHVFSTPTYPYYRFVASDRTLTNTTKVWGTQFGYDSLTLVVKEFWPDVRRAINHKRAEPAAQGATTKQ